jgi:hypothetical protein
LPLSGASPRAGGVRKAERDGASRGREPS